MTSPASACRRWRIWRRGSTASSRRGYPGSHASPCAANPAARAAPIGRIAELLLAGVLDVLDLVELDIDELAPDLLDAADIDGLHDVACRRIDLDRPARARAPHALQHLHRRGSVDIALARVDPAADRCHPRISA